MKQISSIALIAVLVAASLVVVAVRTPEPATAKDKSDLEVQAQSAFAQDVSISFGGVVPGSPSFQIPSGQRLVIEQITGTIRIPVAEAEVEGFVLETYLERNGTAGLQNEELHRHRLAFTSGPVVGGNRIYNISQTTRIYADSAITWPVVRVVAPTPFPNGAGDMTISGYLVPVPFP